MHDTDSAAKNWFDQGGQAYLRYRPDYPPEVAAYLACLCPERNQAVDVGCGSGQLTVQLADHFDLVTGMDTSADQLAHALPHRRVRYLCAPAEKLPLPDASASLITAAQAAHWFVLPQFYLEVRRIAAANAVIALISYGVLTLQGLLQDRFQRFYREEIWPFWPSERRLVDSGYADLDFPFPEYLAPQLSIVKHWNLPELMGYVSTWSAVRAAREAGRTDMLQGFAADMTTLWGDPQRQRELRWPVKMRVGDVAPAG